MTLMTSHFSRRIVSWALALAIVLAAPSAFAGGPPKSKRDLQVREAATHGASTVQVIVRVKPRAHGRIKNLLNKAGVVKADHTLISAFTVEIPLEKLDDFDNDDDVLSMSIDATLTGTLNPGVVPVQGTLLRSTLGLASTPQRGDVSGAGVGVAIVDSGILQQLDFDRRITAFYDFTKGGVACAPYDDYGHGTHVAGVIAAQVNNGRLLIQREASLRSRWDQMRTNTLPNNTSLAEQQMLKAFDNWSRGSGADVNSIMPQWKNDSDDYMTLNCRVEASGDLGTLSRFIYDVEKDPMALKLESVELSTRDNNGQQLTLNLQISGLVLLSQRQPQ